MTLPKDLPPGAQAWAREMERKAESVKHLEAVVQNLTNLLGLDYRNPTRGISPSSAPSVQNPLTLKLNSLNDMDVRGAQDGDFIMWSSVKNKWVTGRPPSSGAWAAATNLWANPNLVAGTAPMPVGFTYNTSANPEYSLSGGVLSMNPNLASMEEYHQLFFTDLVNSAALVEGKPYVLSFDCTIVSGTVYTGSGDTPDISLYGGAYPYNVVQYDTNTIPSAELVVPYVTTNRVHLPIVAGDGTGIDAHLDFNHRGVQDFRADFSNFSITETSTLPWGNWYDSLSTSTDLLALGLLKGGAYVLAMAWYYGMESLTVVADGVELVKFMGDQADLSDCTNKSFTIPAGATAVTLELVNHSGFTVSPSWINIFPEPPAFFSGDTPADANYTYSWAGTPNNSASIRTPR